MSDPLPESHPTPSPGSAPQESTRPAPAGGEATPSLRRAAIGHLKALRDGIGRVVLGQPRVIEQSLITLLCGGHALLEGVPGTAKTLMVRTLASLIDCRAKRVQFTPDLMPADIIGTNIFNLQTRAFEMRQGPIFTDFLIADEINRTPAKTQSALLEAMSESHATIDGVRHELSPVFTVFATQNPVEFEGTYPLPEAQQDRFLMKIKLDYPPEEAERAVMQALDAATPPEAILLEEIKPVMTVADIIGVRRLLTGVRVEPGVLDYVLKIVRSTRGHDLLLMGAGPRGSMSLLQAAKGQALLRGRDFVSPDDVVAMVDPVLGHRVVLSAEAEVSGERTSGVLQSILDRIEVPR
ncbi:MAG: MoxR family ATPase [Planctomycetota bacterium]